MPASKEEIAKLEKTLNDAAEGLPKVTFKKMFGCHALFANENVFAHVWKHGQVAIKLTAEEDFDKLMNLRGSEPWKAGPMKMAHWVLVSDELARSKSKLSAWVKLAHAQALVAPKKKKK